MSSSGTVFDLIFKHFNFKGKVQKSFKQNHLKTKNILEQICQTWIVLFDVLLWTKTEKTISKPFKTTKN